MFTQNIRCGNDKSSSMLNFHKQVVKHLVNDIIVGVYSNSAMTNINSLLMIESVS